METVANDIRVANALHWIARILSIIAILFIGMFSLDVFKTGVSLWQQLLGFFMHNIPTLILIGLLMVAWKRELIGGALIALIALLLAPYIYSHNYSMNHSVSMSLSIVAIINLPFIIVGVLFILSYYFSHKRHS
jgi:hypothetical protein